MMRMEPKKLSYFNYALELSIVDFPIYYIESLSEWHFVIAGGGGSAKTGVHNQINIVELVPHQDSCAARVITKYNDIPDAIMSGSLMRESPIVRTCLVTGGECSAVYKIDYNKDRKSFTIPSHRELNLNDNIEMRCVKCSPGRIMFGAVDGTLRILNSQGKCIQKTQAHSGEIDEIDINLSSKQIVSLSRDDGKLLVWDIDGKRVLKQIKQTDSFRFRSCRYVGEHLIVAYNPVKRDLSKLERWHSGTLKLEVSQPVTGDGIVAMTGSQDGRFVAIGTRAGGVSIFDVNNLGRLYNMDKAHQNAVTKVEFLPSTPRSLLLTNSQLCPLISVSIDRRIILHRPKKDTLLRGAFKTILIILVITSVLFASINLQ